jgi:hypothetical protein
LTVELSRSANLVVDAIRHWGDASLQVTLVERVDYLAGYRNGVLLSAYRWQLQGNTLRLTLTKTGCPDKVAQTILASEPWKRF